MMKKTIYIMMSLAVTMFAAAGCAKHEAGTNGQDCFMTIQPEVVSTDDATKATLINNAAGLREVGFGVSVYNGAAPIKEKESMVYDNGWKPSGSAMNWKWPVNTVFTFYAWSPASLSSSGKALASKISSTGISTFTYADIALQEDVMLGYYSGKGTSNDGGVHCAAPIKFYHALSSIQFRTGKITGDASKAKLTKLTVTGACSTGTCTANVIANPATFNWSGVSGSTNIEQSGLEFTDFKTSGKDIGKPFIMMPQAFNSEKTISVTAHITFSDGTADRDITAVVNSGTLAVGRTTVYSINYDGAHASFNVSVEAWTNGQNENVSFEKEQES